MLGAVPGFDGGREGVVGAKAEFVVDSDDFVERVTNGVFPEEG